MELKEYEDTVLDRTDGRAQLHTLQLKYSQELKEKAIAN